MKKLNFLILCLLLSLPLAQAQQALVIEKMGGTRRYEFMEGETLRLKLESSGEVLSGPWQYAGPNTIEISEVPIALEDIRWIDIGEKEEGIWVLKITRNLLFYAGMGYFTVSHLNILIEPGPSYVDEKVVHDSAVMLSGAFVVAALNAILRRTKIPVKSKRFEVSLVRLP